ncbi:glycosyltransferase family 4 protein [Flaviflagellibacter deserti]|uniref:Glycosyltransferase family 4 protein n=1 Tax=Flaviflagellibacter deserti TaxID=2267266 RepID=A0ABV9Z0L7_9HYPH
MRCLFLAPMKHPDDPSPSGDRTMARLFVRLLENLGYEVDVVSDLRTVVTEPEPGVWLSLRDRAKGEAERIASHATGSDVAFVFTYHNYYRAPDLVGPELAKALGTSYVIAEPSIAPRRVGGEFAEGYALSMQAIQAADLLLCLTENDREVLERYVREDKIADLKPFIDPGAWALGVHKEASTGPVRLLTVAMMRERAKLSSYRILAEALRLAAGRAWTLDIVGDGPVRADVEWSFAEFGGRVRFHGTLADRADLGQVYRAADLFVWPAVDEAFGAVFLEAAAHGVPSVAGAYGGVPDVVMDGETGLLTAPGDVEAFGRAIIRLIDDAALRESLGKAAARFVGEERTIQAAADTVARHFRRHGIPLPEAA